MINLEPTNGKPCSEEQINWLIEQAIKAARNPENHGNGWSTMGDTFIHAHMRYDGKIDIEVTERKFTTQI